MIEKIHFQLVFSFLLLYQSPWILCWTSLPYFYTEQASVFLGEISILDDPETIGVDEQALATNIVLGILFFLVVAIAIILIFRKSRMQKITLERKVYRRTLEVSRQKAELEKQSEELQKAYEEIKSKNIAIEEAFQHLTGSFSKQRDLNQFKESMTAMIVHDFKNSLNTVISFSEGEVTPRRLKSIHQAGKSMLNMVLNMLDVQKFEKTKVNLSLSNHYISAVIEDALEQLDHLVIQKNISFQYAAKKELSCRLDYEMSVRVVTNIVANAIKYAPENSTITIDIVAKDDFVYLSITDQGPGIPGHLLEKVFEKYTQFTPKDSGQVRSTGIGLAFCKLAVEAHGGIIKAESVEGEGASFILTFPKVEIEGGVMLKKETKVDKASSISLTEQEYQVIAPTLEELQEWEVYEFSEIMEVIEDLTDEYDGITVWKEQVISALRNVNEESYVKLINIKQHEES